MQELFKAIFPPDVPAVLRWRLSIFLAVLLMGIHVAWSCGWMKPFGLGAGFAYAGDVAQVREDVSSIKVELIEQRIFDTRLRQCQAGAGEPRSFYREKLQGLLRKYLELTGSTYGLPSCEEL